MKDIWILSFECAEIVKVGGLGEAVYNITEHLAARGLRATLFMPSHGAHRKPEIRDRLNLQEGKIAIRGSTKGNGFLPYRNPFRYNIGMLKGSLHGFDVNLFYGLNRVASDILDDEIVYKANRIEDKALLLARGVSGYVEHLRELGGNPPDVIHAHDYHAIPAAVLAKQKLEALDRKTALVLTIHLLSEKRVSWNYLGERWCGIENRSHPIYLQGRKRESTHREMLRAAKFKLESFGAMEAHVLASVSQSYLKDEVLKHIGPCCDGKAAFHWNGCDWDSDEMLKETLARFGDNIRNTLGITEIRRYDLRKYFLTKAIGNLRPEEPILDPGKVAETISNLKGEPFIGGGRIEPFSEDGPMALMTGRLTEQKGVDVLFKSIPDVSDRVPDARFVLLLLPLEEDLNLTIKFAKLTRKYRRSVRIIFGKVPSIYPLAHLAADIFVCPSKWEPFGIMALEAMATGNPVVATETGGLKEIVVDAARNLQSGTGLLVPKNDHESLANAITSLLAVMRASEILQKVGKIETRKMEKIADCVSESILRKALIEERDYGEKLRENAVHRVESAFRWSRVIDMIISLYEKAISLANLP